MHQHVKNDRFAKVLAIVSFTFIILALTLIVKTPPAGGYEISIYDAYPWYFWFFIITSVFIGQLVLLKNALFHIEDKYWIFGFLAILIANFILLFLPLLRGYVILGREDVLSHIGWMNDILKTGYIGSSNMYPADHILAVIIFLFSGIEVTTLTTIIPSSFFFFYILSCYLLSKQFFQKKSEVLYTLVLTSIPVFGILPLSYLFTPFSQTFFLFPFVLYLYEKSRYSKYQSRFSFLLIILLFSIVFFHPLNTLILIMIFLIIEACLYTKNLANILQNSNFKVRSSYNVILITVITFFMWQSYAYLLIKSFKRLYEWLINESEKSEIQTYFDVIEGAKPALIDLIKLIFSIYGQFIILVIVSLFCVLYLLIVLKSGGKLKFHDLFLSSGFLFFLTFSIISLLIAYIYQSSRIYIITVLFSLFLIPSCISSLLEINKNIWLTKFFKTALLVLLINLLYFSIFNIYLSPIVKNANQQTVQSELTGMETFFNKRDDNISILELGLSQYRFYDAIYSRDAVRKNVVLYSEKLRPIDHFGYVNYTSLSSTCKEQKYFLLNDLGRKFYPNVYPEYKEQWRYTQEDFSKLKEDGGVEMIYTNGNLEIYLTKHS